MCAIAALTATSGIACAADEGWYVFGAAGQTINNNDQTTLDNALTSVGGSGFSSSINNPTVYNLNIGYQMNQNLAFEGGYLASGNETYTAVGGNLAGPISATAKLSNGWTLTAVGILPLANQFSLLGRLGVADTHISGTVTGPGGTASASGSKTDLTYGLGAQYNFTDAFFARLNVDSYKIGDSSSSSRSDVWTLGVGYKF